jgi:hypothetical protein
MNRFLPLALGSVLLAVACQAGPDDSVCGDALGHIAACSGSASTLGSGECDPEQARAVLALSCSDLNPPSDPGKADFWGSGNPLCTFLLPATDIQHGGLCCFDYNCTSDDICSGYRCQAPGEAGAACDRPSHCIGDLICGPSKVCQPASEAGAKCNSNTQCADELSCIQGSCAATSTVGGACDDDDTSDCAPGLNCKDSVCVNYGESGETCSDNFDCDGFLTCIAGSCQPESKTGGSCDDKDSGDCDFGLYCIHSLCAAKPKAGEDCEREPFSMCGQDMTCWQGKCESVHPEGGACENMFDCQKDMFCVDGSCKSF